MDFSAGFCQGSKKELITTKGNQNIVSFDVNLKIKISIFLDSSLVAHCTSRTNSLLEKVCMGVNPAVFYTCLWECLTSNAAVRLPAISFILSHFDKHSTMKEQMYLMGNDVELMVIFGRQTCKYLF